MDLEIEGRTALVLGAGGGLGRAIASALAREGAHVAVADVDAQAASRTARDVEALGGHCLVLEWDLADLAVVEARVASVERELGPVDILINNTGGRRRARPPASTLGHGRHSSRRWCSRSSRSPTACSPECANAAGVGS